MGLHKFFMEFPVRIVVFLAVVLVLPTGVNGKPLSDADVAREVLKDSNKAIVEEFLKWELREVNENVTKYMLNDHPSLIFFYKQVDRGPLKSLLFLEEWVHRLRDAQENIDSFPYSTVFSSGEKKKILGLRNTAKEIISYGIPMIKKDFVRVALAAKELADKRRKHPLELVPDPAFRDAIYRQCETTAKGLDKEVGELSEGELVCIRLGWVLDQVTVTSLWLKVTDNALPEENDYMSFRKKRTEYFNKRLKRIYGEAGTK
ncbi:MAG: hypothetical protein WCG29_04340 [Desulfomonile sp.]|jgi:hypothetical protein|nr:hypothetical protein [Deltaproteobacteria bacterium]